MDPFKKVEIGDTGLYVTRCGLGARGIVDPNVEVSDAQARETIETAFNNGISSILLRTQHRHHPGWCVQQWHPDFGPGTRC